MLDGPFGSILIPTGSTKYIHRPEPVLMFSNYPPGPRVWRLWGLMLLKILNYMTVNLDPPWLRFFPRGFPFQIEHVVLFFWRDANPHCNGEMMSGSMWQISVNMPIGRLVSWHVSSSRELRTHNKTWIMFFSHSYLNNSSNNNNDSMSSHCQRQR